ncbi:MAG TPA: hypothetical protein VGA96_14680 [Fibrella sp.]
MDTVTIELTNPKAMNLLEELEALQLIRVVKKEKLDKPRLSTLLRSSVSPQAAVEFNESIKKARNEWERPI